MSGPPHFVDLHVNPGESVSIQLFDGNETLLRGPATITMISQHTFPPIPMPVQVPPGHMVQQIVDENGTLRHIILSAVNSNGTTTPATTLVPPPPPPQQQPFPYCCCCCYCNTGPTPIPPPPPPPPPPQPNFTNLLSFPGPMNIRRRLPTRNNYNYNTKRSTTNTTANSYHTVNTKSPIRGKAANLNDSQEQLSKIYYPANSIPEQNCELTSEVKASNSKVDSLSPSVSPSISPSVELSLGYSNGECKENGDIDGLHNDSEDENVSDSISSAVSYSPLKSIEETDDCSVDKKRLSFSNHKSESPEVLSVDTETTELLNDNEAVVECKPELGCDFSNVKNCKENESPLLQIETYDEGTQNREQPIENSLSSVDDETNILEKEENLGAPEENGALESRHDTDESVDVYNVCSKLEDVDTLVETRDRLEDITNNDDTSNKANESTEPRTSKPSPHRSPKHLLPQVQVWNLTYTSLTATTVKLKWTLQQPASSQSVAIPRHYMVEMILTKSNGSDGSPQPATRIVYQGSLSSCRISHLNSQQQYAFRVRTASEEHLLEGIHGTVA
ncbi:hypothetical protein B4U80_12849 [Leptotrombidium deliense]|uniref:Fibronectin type-III domain-containing protein n=1 Tax=Leptotrombidium deliense TaxID=299467 RepID=A0A443SVM6_9ACAR|nr:hypothetical protein B4U80_12849 [Leptotrombidium deliense]